MENRIKDEGTDQSPIRQHFKVQDEFSKSDGGFGPDTRQMAGTRTNRQMDEVEVKCPISPRSHSCLSVSKQHSLSTLYQVDMTHESSKCCSWTSELIGGLYRVVG